jgi:hypothetical protein
MANIPSTGTKDYVPNPLQVDYTETKRNPTVTKVPVVDYN